MTGDLFWSRYEVSAPAEIYRDGSRLYTFVPYVATCVCAKRSVMHSFYVALSSDEGENWTFVDAGSLNLTQVRTLVARAIRFSRSLLSLK